MGDADEYKSVHEDAGEVLAELAKKASKQGIRANSKVVFGKPWIEVIREVIGGKFDLTIAGTRNQGPFRRMLYGSMGIKLLRKCPCPVWVTKPQSDADERVESILVAHDLSPVGDAALALGCSLAKTRGTTLHVLHSIENHRTASPSAQRLAEGEAAQRISDQLRALDVGDAKVAIHIDSGYAEEAIFAYIEQHDFQLVVMGTIARSGIQGMLVGNTAEKLLPFLPCSVLAIKPADFKSPILMTDDEYPDSYQ
jgi:universal stress protein E